MKLRGDNVLIKRQKQSDDIITPTNIILRNVEHDFFTGEVVDVGPGYWDFNKETREEEFYSVNCSIGDFVVIEKNFHHVYNIEMRERVENCIKLNFMTDEDCEYWIVKSRDIHLKFDNKEEMDNFQVLGTLYSIIEPKPIKKL